MSTSAVWFLHLLYDFLRNWYCSWPLLIDLKSFNCIEYAYCRGIDRQKESKCRIKSWLYLFRVHTRWCDPRMQVKSYILRISLDKAFLFPIWLQEYFCAIFSLDSQERDVSFSTDVAKCMQCNLLLGYDLFQTWNTSTKKRVIIIVLACMHAYQSTRVCDD